MESLDLSIYYPIPWLNTEGYVSMAKDLLSAAPDSPPQHVAAARDALDEVLGQVKLGLVARIDEDRSTGIERVFDLFVDRVWNETCGRLEYYDLYSHEGIQKLTTDDLEVIDYNKQLERSRMADTIHARLFGDGMEFLHGRYPQQATQMAARLDWLTSKDLDDKLAELITPELATLLKVCQVRYEAMISERSTRDRKSVADIRELRNKLRVQIYAYCGAVGSMLDHSAPKTLRQIEAALRPVLSYRGQKRRKAESEADGEDELFEAEIEAAAPQADAPEAAHDEPASEPEQDSDAAE